MYESCKYSYPSCLTLPLQRTSVNNPTKPCKFQSSFIWKP